MTVTVFVQAKKIGDDNDQTAGAHGMAYTDDDLEFVEWLRIEVSPKIPE